MFAKSSVVVAVGLSSIFAAANPIFAARAAVEARTNSAGPGYPEGMPSVCIPYYNPPVTCSAVPVYPLPPSTSSVSVPAGSSSDECSEPHTAPTYTPPAPTYTPPTPTYTPPASTYTPPVSSVSSTPVSTYTPPASTPSTPASTYTPPASTHTTPASTYTPPASTSTHSSPASTYTPPASTYTTPASNYSTPASTSKPSTSKPATSTYTPPSSTYKPPQSSKPYTTHSTTSPYSTPTHISQCNTGNAHCCNTVQSASDAHKSDLLGQLGLGALGLDLGGITGLIGSGCTGLGAGASCSQQPVCCSGNKFSGLINVGCSPISL